MGVGAPAYSKIKKMLFISFENIDFFLHIRIILILTRVSFRGKYDCMWPTRKGQNVLMTL